MEADTDNSQVPINSNERESIEEFLALSPTQKLHLLMEMLDVLRILDRAKDPSKN